MIAYTMLLETDPDRERFVRLYKDNRRRMEQVAVRLLGRGPRAEDRGPRTRCMTRF